MHTLRKAHWIARCWLVCFVLALGAANATPLVKPSAIQLVCAANGVMQMVITDDDGSVSTGSFSDAHCPLCVLPGLPQSFSQNHLGQTPQFSHIQCAAIPAHWFYLTSSPYPLAARPRLHFLKQSQR